MKKGYTYIMSNYQRTVLYIGVTSDIENRVNEHKELIGSKFTSKYKCTFLLYYEEHDSIVDAIDREKLLKNWNKDWKWDLVKSVNPNLNDLYDELFD